MRGAPLQAAHEQRVELDRNDMADYTEKVLLFWPSNAPKFPAWGRLARVFLSMAPSSAAALSAPFRSSARTDVRRRPA